MVKNTTSSGKGKMEVLECRKCGDLKMVDGVATKRGFLCMECFARLANREWKWRKINV